MNNTYRILTGHWLDVAKQIPDASVQVCVTSPPYYGLRAYGTEPQVWLDPAGMDYEQRLREQKANPTPEGYLDTMTGPPRPCPVDHIWQPIKQYKDSWRRGERAAGFFSDSPDVRNEVGANRTRSREELRDGRWTHTEVCAACNAWRGELGQEPSPALYIAHLVQCFAEIWRTLRPDGLLFVNLGDAHYNYRPGKHDDARAQGYNRERGGGARDIPSFTAKRGYKIEGFKEKDLMLIPWRFAIAMCDAGWWVRSEIIWCLSGGTHVYARTENRDITVTTINALYNARPKGTQLWNGEKWTDLLGIARTPRAGNEMEIVLRSGERVCATPSHQFPTVRGLLRVEDLRIGDTLMRTRLPEPENPRDCVIDDDAAWLAGLYLAEGSKADDTIQVAGHADESERWERCCLIARKFGGYITRSIDGNNMSIRMYGRLLNAILDELVVGGTAHTKAMSANCWRYSNKFLASLLDGYLHGDGHWDELNKRWRIGFCRNYNLERDLRCLCARLGHTLTLKPTFSKFDGRRFPSFRGEIRMERTGHGNERNRNEIVCVRKARSRYMYDLGVADEPNVFALASGLITHNSKPNPLSESVEDRPTKAHEAILMFSKEEKYYYDKWAVTEPPTGNAHPRGRIVRGMLEQNGGKKALTAESRNNDSYRAATAGTLSPGGRNLRTVWTMNVQGYPEDHFAAFCEELPTTCIKAGSSEVGCCRVCFSPWRRIVLKAAPALSDKETLENRWHRSAAARGIDIESAITGDSITLGWRCGCKCPYPGAPVACTVLDPFAGRGTTPSVAIRFGRNAVAVDLQPKYVPMIRKNIEGESPLWVSEEA